jgi:hypothetical protein
MLAVSSSRFWGFHRGLYEDEGTTTIRNVRNYLAVDTSNSPEYVSP